MKDSIREARRQELASDEIEKAQETLAEVVVLRKLGWLATAIQANNESELRNLLTDLRKTEINQITDDDLQERIELALGQGQAALSQILLEREIENVARAARTGSETQLQEAIEQAREANVPMQQLENAMETLSQLTCARVRLELEAALDSDDEAEIRRALKEARSVLPLEELEEAKNKLETLLLLRELSEARYVELIISTGSFNTCARILRQVRQVLWLPAIRRCTSSADSEADQWLQKLFHRHYYCILLLSFQIF